MTSPSPTGAERASLILPPASLRGCIFLAVARDTRGWPLGDAQRFNYYPASPFPMVSWIFDGELRMVLDPPGGAGPRLSAPLPRVIVSGPYRSPAASWSPGPVHALSVSFHPQALTRLLGIGLGPLQDRSLALEAVGAPDAVCEALRTPLRDDGRPPFARVVDVLRPRWQDSGGDSGAADVRGWLAALALRAAGSRPGTGLRQVQRRFKDWTGQSQRELRLCARVEQVMAEVSRLPADQALNLAALAAETGFADQSHLGREVRRVTGLSPARLNAHLAHDEPFWLYRLLRGHLEPGRASEPEAPRVE